MDTQKNRLLNLDPDNKIYFEHSGLAYVDFTRVVINLYLIGETGPILLCGDRKTNQYYVTREWWHGNDSIWRVSLDQFRDSLQYKIKQWHKKYPDSNLIDAMRDMAISAFFDVCESVSNSSIHVTQDTKQSSSVQSINKSP